MSVACADSITATSSSNGVRYASSVVGVGIRARAGARRSRRASRDSSACRRARRAPGARPLERGLDRRALRLGPCGGVAPRAARRARRSRRLGLAAAGELARRVPRRALHRPAPRPSAAVAGRGHHRDAVDRAGRQAEVAAGAQRGDHGVHLLRRARRSRRPGRPAMQSVQPMQRASSMSATRRGCSTPHAGSSGRYGRPVSAASARMPASPPGGQRLMSASPAAIGLGVGPARRVAALRALRLRQERVDRVGERCCSSHAARAAGAARSAHDLAHEPGPAVDEAGVDLHQARAGVELFARVGGAQDAADADDRDAARRARARACAPLRSRARGAARRRGRPLRRRGGSPATPSRDDRGVGRDHRVDRRCSTQRAAIASICSSSRSGAIFTASGTRRCAAAVAAGRGAGASAREQLAELAAPAAARAGSSCWARRRSP